MVPNLPYPYSQTCTSLLLYQDTKKSFCSEICSITSSSESCSFESWPKINIYSSAMCSFSSCTKSVRSKIFSSGSSFKSGTSITDYLAPRPSLVAPKPASLSQTPNPPPSKFMPLAPTPSPVAPTSVFLAPGLIQLSIISSPPPKSQPSSVPSSPSRLKSPQQLSPVLLSHPISSLQPILTPSQSSSELPSLPRSVPSRSSLMPKPQSNLVPSFHWSSEPLAHSTSILIQLPLPRLTKQTMINTLPEYFTNLVCPSPHPSYYTSLYLTLLLLGNIMAIIFLCRLMFTIKDSLVSTIPLVISIQVPSSLSITTMSSH
jgi:hypothetical protein